MTTYYSTVPCYDLVLIHNDQELPELENAPFMVRPRLEYPAHQKTYEVCPYVVVRMFLPACPLPKAEAFYWSLLTMPANTYVDHVGIRLDEGAKSVVLFNNTPYEQLCVVGTVTRSYTL